VIDMSSVIFSLVVSALLFFLLLNVTGGIS